MCSETIVNTCDKAASQIAEKWYKALEFPQKYDDKFYKYLKEIKIAEDVSINTYNTNDEDGAKNLLSYLYMCEKLESRYLEKKINTDILLDTLKDIVRWTEVWSDIKNTLYLGETKWLSNHLEMKLFKLGRLQYYMGKLPVDVPSMGLSAGDDVVDMHIPACGPLTREDCVKSIDIAKAFFAKYYPEFNYKCFTCESWLLDSTLKEILSADSGIIQFQEMFTVVHSEKSDAILKYVFRWDTTRETISDTPPRSSFAQKVKARAIDGYDFYESLGIISK